MKLFKLINIVLPIKGDFNGLQKLGFGKLKMATDNIHLKVTVNANEGAVN